MTFTKAIKLAIHCFDKIFKRIGFDANAYEIIHPLHGDNTWEKRVQLLNANEIISSLSLGPVVAIQYRELNIGNTQKLKVSQLSLPGIGDRSKNIQITSDGKKWQVLAGYGNDQTY